MRQGINRTPLQSEIIKFIQDYIQEENLKTGDKLPSQAGLIEMMGVSRTSLREAIKTMEAKGVLETKNGKGVFVKNDDRNLILSQLSFLEEKESLLEVIEARKILEREILKLTVKNITEHEIEELGKVLKVILDKYHREERQNVEDKQFHYMIYEYCHNRVLYKMMLSVRYLSDKLWEFPLDMKEPFTDTIPFHKDLYNAIKERNAKKALDINDQILDMVYHTVQER
ncbi:FadR family transcriptional regulator [Blautia liquoris]|jgi:DNA-binding FadR family transcriptional regulator|uniref:FadR family transcriptional regulator n=1 Tax=Blautia liquoris TaxID=2779518 RepID=A0A7M2RIH2_9FIRM|nr:FadR/GntR family transcriptional regulator [Blautia liquoris]QOV19928.1 FadR family transcriptional regulator [Blautia liquoris]